jgi:hypothetical protein
MWVHKDLKEDVDQQVQRELKEGQGVQDQQVLKVPQVTLEEEDQQVM